MRDKAIDESLATLKLIPNWFVTSKMINEFSTALYGDKNILYFKGDFGNVALSCKEKGLLNIDLNNINLDNSFDEDDAEDDTFISDF